jgi:Domain of unknown function (DUF4922)
VSWNNRIITESELSRYLKDQTDRSLAARLDALISQQRETWPMLKAGYEALSEIETKRVPVAESSVVVQHNPKRIRSTAAAIDKQSVAGRKCFLCAENLPDEEKGIEYGDDLIILCNPFPVLGRHLSIVHRDHVEQRLQGNVETLLAMARDFGPDYFVLYNGPECGASAPDHLHFQACSRELLPIEDDARGDDPVLVENCASCEETARQTFEVFTLSGCGRGVIVFRGGDDGEVAGWVYRVLDELSRASGMAEPMVNLVCTHVAGLSSVYLFPRSRHRPSCFFAEGENRLLVSPGAIDMSGVIVVPRHEDFEKIDSEHLEAVFAEVSYDEEYINGLIERVCGTVEEEVW